ICACGSGRPSRVPDRRDRHAIGYVERNTRSGNGDRTAPAARAASGTSTALRSRLARNDRDWSQLVELGAITNVVLIDHDGIYDPRLVNDRLLRTARSCAEHAAVSRAPQTPALPRAGSRSNFM